MSETIATDVIETSTELSPTDKALLILPVVAGTILGIAIYRTIKKTRKLEKKTEEAPVHVVTDLEDETTPAS